MQHIKPIHNIRHQQGVALIQVLLISAVVIILAIQFSFTARDQIETARGLDSRIQAQLRSYSLQNLTIFRMLTDEVNMLQNNLPEYFSALPMNIDTPLQLTLDDKHSLYTRDIGGMLALQYPEHPAWQYYLEYMGLSSQEAQVFIHYITDLQDSDQSNHSNKKESTFSMSVTKLPDQKLYLVNLTKQYLAAWPNIRERINEDIHTYPLYQLNITTSSKAVQNSILGNNANAILSETDANRTGIIQLLPVDLDPDSVGLGLSTYKRISTSVIVDNVLWQESLDVRISSLSSQPYSVIGKPQSTNVFK